VKVLDKINSKFNIKLEKINSKFNKNHKLLALLKIKLKFLKHTNQLKSVIGTFGLVFLSLRSYLKVKSENKSFQKKLKLFGNYFFFSFKVIVLL
jgi:hypothetical protein